MADDSLRNPLDLGVLAALGFGPGAALMNEPKLLVDPIFLSTILAEFEDELGVAPSRATLFQIGFILGLRDAARALGPESGSGPESLGTPLPGSGPAFTPAMPMQLGPAASVQPGSFALAGSWPSRFEAEARLARLGATAEPACSLSSGYSSGWLSGLFDADVVSCERSCAARGDDACHFEAREVQSWLGATARDPEALAWIESMDFETCREVAMRDLFTEPSPAPAKTSQVSGETSHESGEFDPDAPVVHVWGPVMVMPFTAADDAMHTVEVLSRDPGLADVRSVVLDLRERILDPGFDAAAVEHVLATVSGWGAEMVLTGVSPLSEAVVEDLEAAHLLIRKDLPEAIAAAFQIAEVQRRPL